MTAEVRTIFPSPTTPLPVGEGSLEHSDRQGEGFIHRTIIQDQSGVLTQIVKFMTVGVLNTLIDASTYFTLTRWLGLASLPVLAKGLAYAIGMINSFYWNRNWTFRSSSNPWQAALLFTLTHIAALGINAGVMYLGLETLNLSEVISLALATSASFGWNFILNKLVVFKS